MSKKNLARSALEGGRSYGNCWRRRHSNALVRVQETAVLSRLRDREDAETVELPKRRPVHRDFHDKLAPVQRWVYAQAGRSWAKVRSELTQRFDTRTTAGRHIIFCHVLPSVEPSSRFHGSRSLYIDRHGLLRLAPPRKRKGAGPRTHWLSSETKAWLAGRRVGERGQYLFWFVLTESGAFRQAHRLTVDEARRFRAIPAELRARLAPSFREEA